MIPAGMQIVVRQIRGEQRPIANLSLGRATEVQDFSAQPTRQVVGGAMLLQQQPLLASRQQPEDVVAFHLDMYWTSSMRVVTGRKSGAMHFVRRLSPVHVVPVLQLIRPQTKQLYQVRYAERARFLTLFVGAIRQYQFKGKVEV